MSGSLKRIAASLSIQSKDESKPKKQRVRQFERYDFFDRIYESVPVNINDVWDQQFDPEEFEKQKPARRADLKAMLKFLEVLGYEDLPSPSRCNDAFVSFVQELLGEEEPSLIGLAAKCTRYTETLKGKRRDDALTNLTLEQLQKLVPGEFPTEAKRMCELLRFICEEQDDPNPQYETRFHYSDGDEIQYRARVAKYDHVHIMARTNMESIREHAKREKRHIPSQFRFAHATGKRYVDVVKLCYSV
jgi:hypothetical protein